MAGARGASLLEAAVTTPCCGSHAVLRLHRRGAELQEGKMLESFFLFVHEFLVWHFHVLSFLTAVWLAR